MVNESPPASYVFSYFAINVRENVLLAIGNLFVLPCPVLSA